MNEYHQNLLKLNDDMRKVHDIFYQAGKKSKAKTRQDQAFILCLQATIS